MLNSVLGAAGGLAYRFGLGPRPSDVPDHRLVELVEGPDKLTPGRAIDLGCGTGRNALFLAAHGWDTVGVEMVGYAVEVARRTAAAQNLAVRFVQGDVTRLEDLGVGAGFTLLMDGGCYHTIPVWRRDAYAESVTRVRHAVPATGYEEAVRDALGRLEAVTELKTAWHPVGA